MITLARRQGVQQRKSKRARHGPGFLIAASASLVSVGCASTPDVTARYYLSKSDVSLRVLRTVYCDGSNTPIVANAITPSVQHSADSAQPQTVPLTRLDGELANTDIKLEFYEDGRLKSINATGAGQGEAILKTAISIASIVGAREFRSECDFIRAAGAGKPLTLSFEGNLDVANRGPQPLSPETSSIGYFAQLASILGEVCATLGAPREMLPPSQIGRPWSGDVVLKARQPAAVPITVSDCTGGTLWEGTVRVAQLGTPYVIPIRSAPLFGKQVFAARFEESGAITLLQYGRETGAGQVLTVGSAALTALQGDSTAVRAAEVKAEADLIVQQQRLVTCLADPANCR